MVREVGSCPTTACRSEGGCLIPENPWEPLGKPLIHPLCLLLQLTPLSARAEGGVV